MWEKSSQNDATIYYLFTYSFALVTTISYFGIPIWCCLILAKPSQKKRRLTNDIVWIEHEWLLFGRINFIYVKWKMLKICITAPRISHRITLNEYVDKLRLLYSFLFSCDCGTLRHKFDALNVIRKRWDDWK